MNLTMFSRRRWLATGVALLAALPLTSVLAAPFASDRITVRTEGAGPDVVLIPGLNSSPRAWASTVAALPGYRYHLVQISGFGGQPVGGNKEGTVAAPVADEIVRYIREANLKQPAVIGHSMGGTIGMMLASRHPDALSRLMVVVQPKSVPLPAQQFDGVYKSAYAPIKNLTLKRIPDSAHFIMWDQPQRFQAEVKAFLPAR